MTVGTSPLADAIGKAILAGEAGQQLDPTRPGDPLAIVVRAAEAETVVRDLLRHSVAAARAHGHSWAAIGDALGLTRQAVQQRFGAGVDTPEGDVETRTLGPVTAFDEMHELELAGRQGWRTVGAGLLRHTMLRTDTQWEHRRVVWRRAASSYERDGWEIGCRAFPWLYLVRDRRLPPEPVAVSTPGAPSAGA